MSLRQEVAAILMNHTDGMKEATYKAILDELGKIPADRDPAEAKALQKELTALQSRTHQLEDVVFDYQDQYAAIFRENQRLHTYSLQVVTAHNIIQIQLDSLKQKATCARNRNAELYRRLHQFSKAIQQPGLLSPKDRDLYSLTVIPTGVYFDTEDLEKKTLGAVQILFDTYQYYYEKEERIRQIKKCDRIYTLQQNIDDLSKTLVRVSAYHLFIHDVKKGQFKIAGVCPNSSSGWGKLWRETDTFCRQDFQTRAQDTWRVVYPYNRRRTTQALKTNGYLYFKKGSSAYRSKLGLIDKTQLDIDFLDSYGLDFCDDQVQLEDAHINLQKYLEEIKCIHINL